eukprot:gene7521-7732_t
MGKLPFPGGPQHPMRMLDKEQVEEMDEMFPTSTCTVAGGYTSVRHMKYGEAELMQDAASPHIISLLATGSVEVVCAAGSSMLAPVILMELAAGGGAVDVLSSSYASSDLEPLNLLQPVEGFQIRGGGSAGLGHIVLACTPRANAVGFTLNPAKLFSWIWKLADFGMRVYLAPEVHTAGLAKQQGKNATSYDIQADIFSLGMLFVAVRSGDVPFGYVEKSFGQLVNCGRAPARGPGCLANSGPPAHASS